MWTLAEGLEMSRRWTACSALAAFILAASPAYAMSVVSAPANSDAASRFTDPNAQPQRGFSGSVTTIIIGGGSSGYGGSANAGTRGFGSPIPRPDDRPRSDLGPTFPGTSFPDRGLPDSTPYGFNPTNPFAGPRDPYAPDFRGNSR